MKQYAVWFDIKKNNHEYDHEVRVFAKNAKEARKLVEESWYNAHTEHMFHVSVHLVKEG